MRIILLVLRWGSPAIAVVALLISLNIEKLAEKLGWDRILVDTVPDLLSSVPWWLWPALFLFFGGASFALWTNKLISKALPSNRISDLFPKGVDARWISPASLAQSYISITLRVFNGTGLDVKVHKPEGFMLFQGRELPRPELKASGRIVSRGSSETFVLEQRLSPQDTAELTILLDTNNQGQVLFRYNTLRIPITALGDNNARVEACLPFDHDGLTISKGIIVGEAQIRDGVSI